MPSLLTSAILALTLSWVSADGVSHQLVRGWNDAFMIAKDDSGLPERELDGKSVTLRRTNQNESITVTFPDNGGRFPSKITLIEVFRETFPKVGNFASITSGGVGETYVQIKFEPVEPFKVPTLNRFNVRIRIASTSADEKPQLVRGWTEAHLMTKDHSAVLEREVVADLVSGMKTGDNDSAIIRYPVTEEGFPDKISFVEVFSGAHCPKGDFASLESGGVGEKFVELKYKLVESSAENETCDYHVRIRVAVTLPLSPLVRGWSDDFLVAKEEMVISESEVVNQMESGITRGKESTTIRYPQDGDGFPYKITFIEVFSGAHCPKGDFASIVSGGVRETFVQLKLKVVKPSDGDEPCNYHVRIRIADMVEIPQVMMYNDGHLFLNDNLVKSERMVFERFVFGWNVRENEDKITYYFPDIEDRFSNKISSVELFSGDHCPKETFASIVSGGLGQKYVQIKFDTVKPLIINQICKYKVKIRTEIASVLGNKG